MSLASPEQLLESLNEQQRIAAATIDGPLLMLAGPGSGKTRVITHRIANMILQGVPSQTILALTFTNKAADEMKNRINELVPGSFVWAGTFHRFCSRMLRQYATMVGLTENFTIYDMGDSRKVVKLACEMAKVDLQHYSVDSIQNHLGQLKNRGITHVEYQPRPGHALDNILARVYPCYQKQLQMANSVDFDDLLLHAVDLLRHNPELRETLDMTYQYVMVDEYQDTNLAQYQLIRLLNHSLQNLGVTGDPDQSIYGWRGANIHNILNFEKDYPGAKIVKLEQNYRSTKSILQVADQLISNNRQRKHKTLMTDNEEGVAVRLVAYPSPKDEASDIADSILLAINQGRYQARDFAIFYRANWLSRTFEHALRQAGVPYQVVNGYEFYQRKEIKDLLAYLQLINNPQDNVAFERIINVPPRKIGKVTVSRIREYAFAENISMLEAARQCGLISTISKGAATKVVKFVAMMDEISVLSTGGIEQILQSVVQETGYRDWLLMDGSDEAHERAGNVDELMVATREFDLEHPNDGGLEAYLEQSALRSDTDIWEGESDYVTLMTMHAAKGLEFPAVYVIGLEDGILPHERSGQDEVQIEEERRLLFVGITRAEKLLQLSRCMTRFKRGSFWPAIASRFLVELPRHAMQVVEPRSNSMYAFGNDDFPVDNGFDNDDDVPFDVEPFAEDAEIQIHGDMRGQEDDESDDLESLENIGDNRMLETGSDANIDGSNAISPSGLQEPKSVPKQSENARRQDHGLPNMMTAKELAQQTADRIHPSKFAIGMQVEHDVYGIGTIIDLSGKNMKRRATIDFPSNGETKIVLAFCNLKIIG